MTAFYYVDILRLTPNVVLRGIATQSSTFESTAAAGSPFIASYAIDGNFDTSVTDARGACSFAEGKPPMWWQVELQEVYEIPKVAITGRKEYGNYVFNYHYIIFFIFVYQMQFDKNCPCNSDQNYTQSSATGSGGRGGKRCREFWGI